MKNDLAIHPYTNLTDLQKQELRKIWIHAVRIDTLAIGWLPTTAFEMRAQANQMTALHRNNDLVGWCMHAKSHARGILKVYQIWVRPDARVIEHGRALVNWLKERAQTSSCYCCEAWVAEDLPANLFWQAIGFSRVSWRWGRGTLPRRHWLWQTYTHTAKLVSGLHGRKKDN